MNSNTQPSASFLGLPAWTIVAPAFAAVTWTLAALGFGAGALLVGLVAIALAVSVFAAVHHAEVVAHRTGEPFGTLVLALAVTLIEVALIVSLMIAGGPETAALALATIVIMTLVFHADRGQPAFFPARRSG